MPEDNPLKRLLDALAENDPRMQFAAEEAVRCSKACNALTEHLDPMQKLKMVAAMRVIMEMDEKMDEQEAQILLRVHCEIIESRVRVRENADKFGK